MTFACFDLSRAIQAHNVQYPQKRLSESETFGLDMFSSEQQRDMKSAFHLYDNVHYEKRGFELPTASKTYRSVLVSIRNSGTSEGLRKIRRVVKERLQDKQLTEDFLEREKKSRELNLHVSFMHYHSSAILRAYDYLRFIERELLAFKAIVRKERKRRFKKIPPEILSEMKKYVDEQLLIVKEHYKILTEGMLERLTLASNDASLTEADILYATVKRLKQEGVVNRNYEMPCMPADKFTPELFQRYHQAIALHGAVPIKSKLSKLPWLSPIKFYLPVSQQIAARFGVLKDLPSKPKSPRFLFSGHNLRHEWFDSFYSFAQIDIFLEKTKMLLEGESKGLTDEALLFADVQAITVGSVFEDEKERCEKSLAEYNVWWRRPFHKKTLSFIDRVSQELNNKKQIFLNLKADIQHKQDEIAERNRQIDFENRLLIKFKPEFLSMPYFENVQYPTRTDLDALIKYCEGLSIKKRSDRWFIEAVDTLIEKTVEEFRRKSISAHIPRETLQCYIKLVEIFGNPNQREILMASHDPLQNEFEKVVKELDKKIIDFLFANKKLELSDKSKDYWMMRRNEMLEQNKRSITHLPDFSLSDETFFGLDKGVFEYDRKNERQVIGLLLNFTTGIYLDMKKLEKIHGTEEKNQVMDELKAKWQEDLKVIKNKDLEEIFTGIFGIYNEERRGLVL
jgi:hypothetical protein